MKTFIKYLLLCATIITSNTNLYAMKKNNFENIPDDCVLVILEFLKIKELLILSGTSKRNNNIVLDQYFNQKHTITVPIDMEFIRDNKTTCNAFKHLKKTLVKKGEVKFLYCKKLNNNLFAFNFTIQDKKLLEPFCKIFTNKLLQNKDFISYIHNTTPIHFHEKVKSLERSSSTSISKLFKFLYSCMCKTPGSVERVCRPTKAWIALKIELLVAFGEIKQCNEYLSKNESKIIAGTRISKTVQVITFFSSCFKKEKLATFDEKKHT